MADETSMESKPTRRILLGGAIAAPVAALTLSNANALTGIDPALTAFQIAVDAEDASNAAYEAADENTPGGFVKVYGEIASTPEQIDRLVSKYRFDRVFAGANWAGSRTSEQQERDKALKAATAGPVPDADALKAYLAERERIIAEAFQKHRVEEKRAAFREAQQNLIDTPATTPAGIAAKLRFAVGIDAEPDEDDAESALIHAAIADAERLAQS